MTTEIVNNRNKAPVYEYFFTYDAPFGFMKALFQLDKGEFVAFKLFNLFLLYY